MLTSVVTRAVLPMNIVACRIVVRSKVIISEAKSKAVRLSTGKGRITSRAGLCLSG